MIIGELKECCYLFFVGDIVVLVLMLVDNDGYMIEFNQIVLDLCQK